MTRIYLDNNATSFMLPEVADAVWECFCQGLGNPASQHSLGRRARRVLDDAREAIGAILGAQLSGPQADRLIFTSGGTEANNFALQGASGRAGPLVVSGIEHPSVLQTADYLAQAGLACVRLPVDPDGRTLVDALRERLRTPVRLVSVMLANHETGVLQPVQELAAICRERAVWMHTDAVQAVGKIPLSFRQLGVDMLSFSAHKFHGPVGIGGLLVRHGVAPEPLLRGGFQQRGMRAGTEPVALIVGVQRALELWHRDARELSRRLARRRNRFEALLVEQLPDVAINGGHATRVPHTTNIAFGGADRQALLMALDLAGIACSTGSACASGSSEPSPVLRAMGVSEERVRSSLRFSFSRLNDDADVDQAVERIVNAVRGLCSAPRARK